MSEIERKALALVNEVAKEMSVARYRGLDLDLPGHRALCRAIEQHEAFRQEVSDAVEEHLRRTDESCSSLWRSVTRDNLSRFIIPRPDPLVEALKAIDEFASPTWIEQIAPQFRAALAARGLKIVEDK